MVHPIIDEYYSYSPYHSRSSKYVQDKGLVTNEKGTLGSSPATTPGIPLIKPTSISSSLRDSIASTLAPPTRLSALSSAVANAPTDKHTLSSPQIPHFGTQQQTHNTKKKRISAIVLEDVGVGTAPDSPVDSPVSPPGRGRGMSYGNPDKIAQYFPELNTGF